MKSLNLNTILLIALAVFVTLQIRGCFEKTPLSKEVIEAHIKQEMYEKELPLIREELVSVKAKYDSLLTASHERYDNLEKQKQPIRYVISKIPSIVGSLDREQLRQQIANY